LDAQSRSALLGEEQLPGKSVFDFLSPSARARIVAMSGKSNLPAAGGEKGTKGQAITEEEQSNTLQNAVPHLDSSVALQALARGASGWMPYAEDEAKRSRYRIYLETQAGTRGGLPTRPNGVSKDGWIVEMQEFARVAQLFKPVNGLMASKFTSSSQPLGAADAASSTPLGSLLTKPASRPEDPAEAAAKLGMFGPMTRAVQSFYPTRLLCKRFNVKPPDIAQPEPADVLTQQNTPNPPGFQSSRFQMSSNIDVGPAAKSVERQLMLESRPSNTSGGGTANEEQPSAVDTGRNEAVEAERPGQAVFKAIFGSDDEDE
jgi:G patch domain-containing protein 1